MEKLVILANFHVFVAQEGLPERKVTFERSQVVAVADLPEGQSAEDWIAKGLAKAA